MRGTFRDKRDFQDCPRCENRVQEIVDEINNRPMRALGYRTPAEAFVDELVNLQA